MQSFLGELKRRNMFLVMTGYLVVAWLILQVAAILLPAFGMPDWMRDLQYPILTVSPALASIASHQLRALVYFED